jgi:hypothetical protein
MNARLETFHGTSSQLDVLSPYFMFLICFSLGLELMMSLFLVFEVMEPLGDFMEEHYNLSEYKLTWMCVVTFFAMHVYFIYILNIHILQLL